MPRLSLRFGIPVLALALGVFAGACFTPPADDVLFSCEFEGEDACPPDYRCESDNCCHRVGSNVEANLGACALGGAPANTGTETNTDTGSDTEDSADTDTETDTGTETG